MKKLLYVSLVLTVSMQGGEKPAQDPEKKVMDASIRQANEHMARQMQDSADKRKREAQEREQKQEVDECLICREELEHDASATIGELGCKHRFHVSCVNRWLPINSSCPHCRAIHIGAPEKYYTPEQEAQRQNDFSYHIHKLGNLTELDLKKSRENLPDDLINLVDQYRETSAFKLKDAFKINGHACPIAALISFGDKLFGKKTGLKGEALLVVMENGATVQVDYPARKCIYGVTVPIRVPITLTDAISATMLDCYDSELHPRSISIREGVVDNTVYIFGFGQGLLYKTLVGHNDKVVSAHFNRDGTKVVSSSFDGTIKVWDVSEEGAAEAKCLLTLECVGDKVTDAAFNADGSQIVSISWHDPIQQGNTVRIWDVRTGKCLHSFAPDIGDDAITSVCFNQDGSQVIGGSYRGIIRVWESCPEILSNLTKRAKKARDEGLSPQGVRRVLDAALEQVDAVIQREKEAQVRDVAASMAMRKRAYLPDPKCLTGMRREARMQRLFPVMRGNKE